MHGISRAARVFILLIFTLGAGQALAGARPGCVEACNAQLTSCEKASKGQVCRDNLKQCIDQCSVRRRFPDRSAEQNSPELLTPEWKPQTLSACARGCDDSAYLCRQSNNDPNGCDSSRKACRTRCGD